MNDDARLGKVHVAWLMVAAIIALGSTSASAGPRSEEQLDGLVEGKTQAGPCGDVATVKAIGSSPATYRYVCRDRTTYDVVFKKAGTCKYARCYLKNGAVDSDVENLDFGKFQKLLPLDPSEQQSLLPSRDGFCARGSGAATPCESLISLDNGRCCAFLATVAFQDREIAVQRLLKDFGH